MFNGDGGAFRAFHIVRVKPEALDNGNHPSSSLFRSHYLLHDVQQ